MILIERFLQQELLSEVRVTLSQRRAIVETVYLVILSEVMFLQDEAQKRD